MTGYIGIGGKAKTIKQMYIGIGGKAKKVKKAYIGVGGKAKLWWSDTREQTLKALMSSATLAAVGYYERSVKSTASLQLPVQGTYYAFSFCDKYLGIFKVKYENGAWNVSSTGYGNYTANYGHVCLDGDALYYSGDGTAETKVFGATVGLFRFGSYTEAEADAILAQLTVSANSGYNKTSPAKISLRFDDFPISAFIATQGKIAFVRFNSTDADENEVYFSNNADYRSMMTAVNTIWSDYALCLKLDGENYSTVYGGSIIAV